jgi:WD40 repeat protein
VSEANLKPIIFLAFANAPAGEAGYLRNLAEEKRQIQKALAQASEVCEVIALVDATFEDIKNVFLESNDRIAIFHFAGHASQNQLMLEANDGSLEAANASGFAAFLAQRDDLRLVFLNGCSTQAQVEDLHRAGVPAVIATTQEIDDSLARLFAQSFYESLATGMGSSLREAFLDAQATIAAGADVGITRKATTQLGGVAALSTGDWRLFPNSEKHPATSWKLHLLAGDPLFGLPPIPPLKMQDQVNEKPTPYRNLQWFDRQHAHIFFGRGDEIRELYDLMTSADTPPLILLYGQSGVGKSSLLDAGLTPRLEVKYDVRYVRRDQNLGALTTLQKALGQPREKPARIILDQLEEMFTRASDKSINGGKKELNELIHALPTIFAANSAGSLKLIFGFRKEFLPEIETVLNENGLAHAKVFLKPLSHQGIIEAIEKPATTRPLHQLFNLSIERGLAEKIANDLEDQESPIAPTLQILLSKMWQEASTASPASPQFDQTLYQGLSKDYTHLKGFLDRQLQELKTWRAEVIDSGLAIDYLAFHTTALGTARECTEKTVNDAYAHRQDVLEDLRTKTKDLFLITDGSSQRLDAPNVTRLAHDTLAPLVRECNEASDKPGQRARRILENRAVEWIQGNVGTPLDERDLKVVEGGLSGMRTPREDEVRLLKASMAEREKRDGERQHQQRNLEKQLAQKRMWRSRTIVALVVSGVFAAGVLYLSGNQVRSNNLSRSKDLIDRVNTINSESTLKDDPSNNPSLKLLMLIEAHRLNRSETSTERLQGFLDGFDTRLEQFLPGHTGVVAGLAFSPDGRWLASAGYDGLIRIWNLNVKEKAIVLNENDHKHGKNVDTVAFFVKENFKKEKVTYLVSGGFNGSVTAWKLDETNAVKRVWHNKLEKPTLSAEKYVTSLSLNSDGRILASGHFNGHVQLWSFDTGDRLEGPSEPASGTLPITEVRFCQNGIISASIQEGVHSFLWDQIRKKRSTPQPFPALTKVSGDFLLSNALTSQECLFPTPGVIPEMYVKNRQSRIIKSNANHILVDIDPSVGVIAAVKRSDLEPSTVPKLYSKWRFLRNAMIKGVGPTLKSLAISQSGNRFASGYVNGTIAIWKLDQNKAGLNQPKHLERRACNLLRGTPADVSADIRKLMGKDVYKVNCSK